MTAHEIYHVVVNLCMTRKADKDSRDVDAEEGVRRLVEARLKGPGVTASRVSVFRAFETTLIALREGETVTVTGTLVFGRSRWRMQEVAVEAYMIQRSDDLMLHGPLVLGWRQKRGHGDRLMNPPSIMSRCASTV